MNIYIHIFIDIVHIFIILGNFIFWYFVIIFAFRKNHHKQTTKRHIILVFFGDLFMRDFVYENEHEQEGRKEGMKAGNITSPGIVCMRDFL